MSEPLDLSHITRQHKPEEQPIPMILHCPNCGLQHIDRPDPNPEWCVGCTPDDCPGCGEGKGKWKNPPHRSHLCIKEDGGCGFIWRPCDFLTTGVASITTHGEKDQLIPTRVREAAPQRVYYDRRNVIDD